MLRRSLVSAGARALLPFIPLFSIFVGSSFMATPRTQLRLVPAYNYADGLFPMPIWGGAFILVGLFLALALLMHRISWYGIGLGVIIVWMGLWSLMLVGAAAFDDASWSAWAWPAFVVVTCWSALLYLEELDL